jgi:hypothetical protein
VSEQQYIYHLCIIDYLQDFNGWKKAEYYGKNLLKNRRESEKISSVNADLYQKRYVKFMRKEVIKN